MKLSRKFVSDYIDLPDISIKQIAEDMTSIGNEFDYSGKLVNATNLVIGKIINCMPHPDSDKLKLTKVDIGTEILDIVCGAPNAREGIKVIVAKVGAILPEIEIKASVIRGEKSNGMLCALSELGIEHKFLKEEDFKGIHELEDSAIIGEDPIKFLNLDDEIIDFELTSNRGDLLSIIGMAYELSALYKKKVKELETKYTENTEDINNTFKLEVNTENCPLFLVKQIKNIEIKESPSFIKNRLMASGIRSINNVVDISNYVMLETGQPLHFYDADDLGNEIEVRMAKIDEEVCTLDGKTRTLSEEDIVITNGKKAIGLAGVMGGLDTEVKSTSKNIIIESAIFDSIKIRKTSQKILRSEASNRFEKGIDPKRTYLAIEKSCYLLEKYANATIVGNIVEYNNISSEETKVEVSYEKVNKVLGLKIAKEEVIEILNSLGFKVQNNKDSFTVTTISRRPDVKIVEDIIEEIGRIYGIDKIEGRLPLVEAKVGKYNTLKREIKNKMISFGLNETLTYTLIKKDNTVKYAPKDINYIKVADPMSEEKAYLRYSIIPSLIDVFNYNKSRNFKDISIFEIGKGFFKEDIYKEELKLACLMTGNYHLGINKIKVDFYIIKGILEELLDYLGFSGRYSLVNEENIYSELHPGQSASIILQGKNIGFIGKVHPKESKEDLSVFEINLDKLFENSSSKMVFKDITKFPSVKKDIAFIMDKKINSEIIEKSIKKSGGKLLTSIEVFDYYIGENIEDNKKSIAYSLTFSDKNKTLNEEEVMEVFNKIIKETTEKNGVILRDK